MSQDSTAAASSAGPGPVPKDYLAGLKENARFDLMSGMILFLIALPLSLAIAIASGVPAIAGVLTAMVGGMVGAMLGGSHVTINGAAAGLIVIVLGAVTELGGGDPILGYKLALAVGVAMGVIQIIMGLAKAGTMTNLFPFSVVEGMIAGIGVIIMSKQIHVVLGVKAGGNMLAVISAIPNSFHVVLGVKAGGNMLAVISAIPNSFINMAPQSAIIGATAIAIMILWPKLFATIAKFVPAPMVIMMVTIPMGIFMGLDAKLLVNVPLNFADSFVFPDFSQITSATSIKYIITFVLVGSLESLLTAAAMEKKDPWKRRNNMNRELWSKGVSNTISSLIGGIPMIAEVVRSSTNIMVGARTRWSNFFHGFFMLVFVAGLPWLLNMIPLAALAGMLCVIGFRLAHPNIWIHISHTGKDELVFMVATTAGVVLIDLLVGVLLGMWLSIAMNAIRAGKENRFKSVPLFLIVHAALFGIGIYFELHHNALMAMLFMLLPVVLGIVGFKTNFEVKESGDSVTVAFGGPVVYTSMIQVRNMLDKLPGGKKVVIDFSNAGLIDHTVREKFSDFAAEYARDTGGTVTQTGLEKHTATCHHELASLVR